jgi:hypothetical protein
MELSLKPFLKTDQASVLAAAAAVMEAWAAMAARAEEVAVLLWVGDGSDILGWHGDLDERLAWSRHIGFCNYDEPGAYDPAVRHYRINRAVPYVRRPPDLRYRDLRRIVRGLRLAARQVLGKPLSVGCTIDPGPEFAVSAFKFRDHPEIQTPDLMACMPMRFITHQAALKADGRRYGGFPDGIPAGTGLGFFLGRQFDSFRRAMGLDYLWLSNGFGYSHYPWGPRGELFRGRDFDPARAEEQRLRANGFWRDLRAACPDAAVEVRGTNYTVGMDLASDGCSHSDIMALGGLARPPCNPPWGSRALGLEIAAYLSRLARTPSDRLPFRFYLNDPWFTSNAWYDYYNREPYDIYVPLSLSRLNARGGVDTPTDVSLLTVNTETGALPPGQAGEVTPHLFRALDERADAPGPFVWVYPFDEYDAVLKREPGDLRHLFHQDWFFCQALNAGFPVSTVCASGLVAPLDRAGLLPDSVFVAPVPRGECAYLEVLLRRVRRGGRVLLYGALDKAPPALLAALGVSLETKGLSGELDVELRLKEDRFEQEPRGPASDGLAASLGLEDAGAAAAPAGRAGRVLRHRAEVDGGGLRAVAADWSDPALRVVARRGRVKRVYALSRSRPGWKGGRLAWIWGSTGFDNADETVPEGRFDQPGEARLASEWLRRLLPDFGWDILQERRDASVKPACLVVKRRKGAWHVVGHKPNTSVRLWVRAPDGAPVYAESETPIRDGYAGESFHKTINSEVRAFVTMADGIVSCKELAVPLGRRRHLCFGGLREADVVLYPDPDALAGGSVWLCGIIAGEKAVPFRRWAGGRAIRVSGYTGELYLSW